MSLVKAGGAKGTDHNRALSTGGNSTVAKRDSKAVDGKSQKPATKEGKSPGNTTSTVNHRIHRGRGKSRVLHVTDVANLGISVGDALNGSEVCESKGHGKSLHNNTAMVTSDGFRDSGDGGFMVRETEDGEFSGSAITG